MVRLDFKTNLRHVQLMLRTETIEAEASLGPTGRAHDGPDSSSLSELTEAVAAAAKGLRFGSIEIVVHDARVVQIIRTEKRRMVR
jgi:hypothetical protein